MYFSLEMNSIILIFSGFVNIIKAAKKAGVKQLVHTSAVGLFDKPPEHPVARACYDSFYPAEKKFANINGEDGLKTCVVAPPNIVGLNTSVFFYHSFHVK